MPKISKYLSLVKEKRFPYFQIAQQVIKKIEGVYDRVKDFSNNSGEIKIYFTLDPKTIQNELREMINKKVSTHVISWTIDALFLGSKFRKFRITHTAGGRKRYLLDLDRRNLSIFKNFLESIDEKAKTK